MITPSQVTLNSLVSFELFPNQNLPIVYERVKVQSILDAETARYLIDPAALHVRMISSLPAHVPDRYDAYHYLKILLPTGQSTAIGLPWIKEETWQELSARRVTVEFEGLSPEDENRLVKALGANGLRAFKVSYPD